MAALYEYRIFLTEIPARLAELFEQAVGDETVSEEV